MKVRYHFLVIFAVIFNLSLSSRWVTNAQAEQPSEKSTSEQRAAVEALRKRYPTLDVQNLKFTEQNSIPVILRGGTAKDSHPPIDTAGAIEDKDACDVVIAGGGIAGLTAGVYLTDAGKKVLLLEKNRELGGLGAQSVIPGFPEARGGAYITEIEGAAKPVYEHIGLSVDKYTKRNPIPEPIDAFSVNEAFYPSPWDEKVVETMPADFQVYLYLLRKANDEGLIGNQPLEDFPGTKILDPQNYAEWIRKMPTDLGARAARDPVAKALLEKLKTDKRVDPKDPMSSVIRMMNLYGRSALGDVSKNLNGESFANFYISEVETRYTGVSGTGLVVDALKKTLAKGKRDYHVKLGSPVGKIVNTPTGAEVYYVQDGKVHKVQTKKVVFSAPVRLAPKLIDDFAKIAPAHKKVIDKIEFRDYLVINLHMKGHPWFEAYDTWLGDNDTEDQLHPTDVIVSRWIESKGKKENLPKGDDKGALTIYFPLPKAEKNASDQRTYELAQGAIDNVVEKLNKILAAQGKPLIKKSDLEFMEINRWPDSILVNKPGHFKDEVPVLKTPIGNIVFGTSNQGTDAVEEALADGRLAATLVLKQLDRTHSHKKEVPPASVHEK